MTAVMRTASTSASRRAFNNLELVALVTLGPPLSTTDTDYRRTLNKFPLRNERNRARAGDRGASSFQRGDNQPHSWVEPRWFPGAAEQRNPGMLGAPGFRWCG